MRSGLRWARTARSMSVADVAATLGISASFYYKIEQGARNPTIDLAKRLADLLGGTVDQLFFATGLDNASKTARASGDDDGGQ